MLCIAAGVTPIILHAGSKPLSMVTGGEAGTYIRFGEDIASVASDKPYEQPVNVLKTSGSIDNIKRITSSKGGVSLGIVQSDILGFLSRSTNKNTRATSERLSLLFPFYEEEVHILARRDIGGLRDLAGKRVIVGEEGSGNMLTAMNVLALAEVEPGVVLNTAPAEGVVSVLSGEADAMIFVGGKPVALFSNLSELKTANNGKNAHLLEQVHLVPIDDQRVYAEYLPTRINVGDYPFVDSTLLTAKVSALLVSYEPSSLNSKSRAAYCEPLHAVSRAIVENIDRLKTTGHPKWKEVNLYEDVSLWKKNSCVWDGKKIAKAVRNMSEPVTNDPLSKDLLDIVKYGKGGKK